MVRSHMTNFSNLPRKQDRFYAFFCLAQRYTCVFRLL